MEQKVSVCSKTWESCCVYETVQLHVHILTFGGGGGWVGWAGTADCKLWEQTAQDYNSNRFSGSTLFTEDQGLH